MHRSNPLRLLDQPLRRGRAVLGGYWSRAPSRNACARGVELAAPGNV